MRVRDCNAETVICLDNTAVPINLFNDVGTQRMKQE